MFNAALNPLFRETLVWAGFYSILRTLVLFLVLFRF